LILIIGLIGNLSAWEMIIVANEDEIIFVSRKAT
jgi:hypothetical protein